MRKIFCVAILCVTVFSGCQNKENADASPIDLLPLARDSKAAKAYFSDFLEHPWIRLQPGISEVNIGMVYDLMTLQEAHTLFESQVVDQTKPTVPLEKVTKILITQLQSLQKSLEPLKLNFPEDLYNVLNIAESPPNYYKTPLPFQVFRRTFLSLSENGFPIYMDLRIFTDNTSPSAEELAYDRKKIMQWHLNLLEGSSSAFTEFVSEDGVHVFMGRGDRNVKHFDPSQGHETKNRGIFLAFLPLGSSYCVLISDAPWSLAKQHKDTFLKTVNRALQQL